MQASSRVTINTAILYARMAITVFISLYTTRLILDALGASDFGIFNVVAGAITMLTFLNSAMSTATQRFMSYAEGEAKENKQIKIFNASVVLHFVIGILVIILMEAAGYFLFRGILEIPSARLDIAKLIFHFTVISTWFSILSVPYNAVINAHENMLFMAVVEIVEKLLRLGIAIYITYSPFSYDKLAVFGFLLAVSSFILLLIRHIYCYKKYDEVRFGVVKYFDRPLFRDMAGFASWSLLGSSTSMVAFYGQGIVLNMFFGTVINAAHGIANDVSGKLGSFSHTMRRALAPVIDKSEGAGKREKMLQTSILGGKISFFLLGLLVIPVIIEMPLILNFWLEEVPDYAIIFCQLLLIQDVVEQLFYTLQSSINAVGNIRNFKIVSSITHSLPLLFSFIFFSIGFPPYWLYIIFIIYALLNAVVVVYYTRKVCGLVVSDFFKNTVLRCGLAFIFILGLAMLPYKFMEENFIRLIVIFVITMISLPLSVWFIALQDYEQDIFKRMVKRFNNRIIKK